MEEDEGNPFVNMLLQESTAASICNIHENYQNDHEISSNYEEMSIKLQNSDCNEPEHRTSKLSCYDVRPDIN